MSGTSLGGSAPWWWATMVGGSGLLMQGLRAVYKDFTEEVRAKAAVQAARILALESEIKLTHAAHLADVTKLMLDAITREHGVVTAMNTIPELPGIMKEEMHVLRTYLASEREGTRTMFSDLLRPALAEILRGVLREVSPEEREILRDLLREELDRYLGDRPTRVPPPPRKAPFP